MTIQQICQLSEEVRTGELLEAVFIDQAIKDPDSKEAVTNFVLRATYPTVPLRGLVELMAQKLSGEHPKGTVVIRGDYGSGKSHALLALYHVASLGSEAQGWLDEWNIHGRPSTSSGRGFPEHINVALVQLVSENPDTFWELLFERAGRPEINAQIRNYPTREQWADLASDTPTLLISASSPSERRTPPCVAATGGARPAPTTAARPTAGCRSSNVWCRCSGYGAGKTDLSPRRED